MKTLFFFLCITVGTVTAHAQYCLFHQNNTSSDDRYATTGEMTHYGFAHNKELLVDSFYRSPNGQLTKNDILTFAKRFRDLYATGLEKARYVTLPATSYGKDRKITFTYFNIDKQNHIQYLLQLVVYLDELSTGSEAKISNIQVNGPNDIKPYNESDIHSALAEFHRQVPPPPALRK